MKKYQSAPFLVVFVGILIISCGREPETAGTELITNQVPDKLVTADPASVHFEGYLGEELDKVLHRRIISDHAAEVIIPEATRAFRTRQDDHFLAGGVERGHWQGEFWGKWILSAIQAYRYTGDEDLKATIRKETMELIATQREDGYIGTYQHSDFVVGNVWNVWCRKYTLWGLVEAYGLFHDPKILEAACRHMDQLMTEVGPGKIEMVHTGIFAGLPSSSILSPLIILYRYTGDTAYRDYARYVVENWGLEPGQPPDIVRKGLEGKPVHQWFPEAGRWTKAYEFISCVEGLVDLYKLEGNENYLAAAENIYDAIAEHERNIAGGIGYHDKLVGAADQVEGLYEPCDVVYWERLSAKLLALTGEERYAEEIERLTYNTLMGTFNEKGNWAVRRMGLNEPHLVAPLHCFLHHHQCCVANIPRGLLQLAEVAMMSGREQNELYVNLFIPGSYQVDLADGRELDLEVETGYPVSGEVLIRFRNQRKARAGIHVRRPAWCGEENFLIAVNGAAVRGTPDQEIDGSWKAGDEIRIRIPMPLRLIRHSGQKDHIAFMRGPVLLARSSMLEGAGIDEPLILPASPVLEPLAQKDAHVRMHFELALGNGESIRLIDFASAGKIFEKPDDPYAVREMLANRVGSDQRVWFRQQ